MQRIDLKPMTDIEIAGFWNDWANCFEVVGQRPRSGVGFFQLSRETERRCLQLGKDRLGKIILEPKIKT